MEQTKQGVYHYNIMDYGEVEEMKFTYFSHIVRPGESFNFEDTFIDLPGYELARDEAAECYDGIDIKTSEVIQFWRVPYTQKLL